MRRRKGGRRDFIEANRLGQVRHELAPDMPDITAPNNLSVFSLVRRITAKEEAVWCFTSDAGRFPALLDAIDAEEISWARE